MVQAGASRRTATVFTATFWCVSMDVYGLRDHLLPRGNRSSERITQEQQVLVLDQVDEQLVVQPLLPTRKRKLLRPNPIAP